MAKTFFTLLTAILLFSCNSNKTEDKGQGTNALSKYKYATLNAGIDYDGTTLLMDGIYDAFNNYDIELLGEHAVREMTDEQTDSMLVVKMSIAGETADSIITVNLLDYKTQEIKVSCKSEFGGQSQKGFKEAVDEIKNEISNTLKK